MRALRAWTAAFVLFCGAAAAQTADIPVVLPLTGGAAFLGQGERTALQIAEKLVNAEGGINDLAARLQAILPER